jgi:hypothetical protein
MQRVHQDEPTREQLMLDFDEIARAGARRGCSPRHSKQRSMPISIRPKISVMREDAPWSFAMGVPQGARDPMWGRGRGGSRAPRVNAPRVITSTQSVGAS